MLVGGPVSQFPCASAQQSWGGSAVSQRVLNQGASQLPLLVTCSLIHLLISFISFLTHFPTMLPRILSQINYLHPMFLTHGLSWRESRLEQKSRCRGYDLMTLEKEWFFPNRWCWLWKVCDFVLVSKAESWNCPWLNTPHAHLLLGKYLYLRTERSDD